MQPMKGYEDYYLVCSTGKLFNKKSGRELKGYTTPKGYVVIKLYDGRRMKLHRIVALQFIPNPDRLDTVDHIDGNKYNNDYTNLRWCSLADNLKYYHQKQNYPDKKPQIPRDIFLNSIRKPVKVNGIKFISITEAAKYIANKENKNHTTVKREIRRYVQGKRSSWCMYGKYLIE